MTVRVNSWTFGVSYTVVSNVAVGMGGANAEEGANGNGVTTNGVAEDAGQVAVEAVANGDVEAAATGAVEAVEDPSGAVDIVLKGGAEDLSEDVESVPHVELR